MNASITDVIQAVASVVPVISAAFSLYKSRRVTEQVKVLKVTVSKLETALSLGAVIGKASDGGHEGSAYSPGSGGAGGGGGGGINLKR